VAEASMDYTVYILQSYLTKRYYIGMTSDLEKRLSYHNNGRNKSTKHGMPWVICYYERCDSKKSAWLRERQIKSYKGGVAFKKLVENNR
jgi:putative endonuclease